MLKIPKVAAQWCTEKLHKITHTLTQACTVEEWFLGFRGTPFVILHSKVADIVISAPQEINQYFHLMILQYDMRLPCQSSVASFPGVLRCPVDSPLEVLEISLTPLKSVDFDPRRPRITKNQTNDFHGLKKSHFPNKTELAPCAAYS